jgi:aryl-alcohol dehydrogenase-like predicted oxidoreductase
MDYVNLGRTGLKVSRLALGLHDLRIERMGAWVLVSKTAPRF